MCNVSDNNTEHTACKQIVPLINLSDDKIANNCRSENNAPKEHVDTQQMVPQMNVSMEEMLNNDFFFDDEFAVSFDAYIPDIQDDVNSESSLMIDSAEIDAIIKNQGKLTKSGNYRIKSDSYLCHADCELSTDSDVCDQIMAEDISHRSDKDISSSSMSDKLHLNRKLLTKGSDLDISSNMERQSYINNSFLCTEGKFDFDWKAAKDNYMISFDKNIVSKYSSQESSFSESTGHTQGKELTTWAKQTVKEEPVSTFQSRKSINVLQNERLVKQNCMTTRPFELAIENKDQALTTWRQVTSLSPRSKSDDGFYLIPNCTKDSLLNYNNASLGPPHSLSLPNIGCNRKLNGAGGVNPTNPCYEATDSTHTFNDRQCSSEEANLQNFTPPKTSLYQLFQRSKSQSGSDSSSGYLQNNLPLSQNSNNLNNNCYQEAILSPKSLKRLTGTWSMSSISSGRKSQCHSTYSEKEISQNFSKWGTTPNLPEINDDLYLDLSSSMMESEGDMSISAHSMDGYNEHLDNSRNVKIFIGGCDCELSGCLQCASESGSGYLTDSYSSDWTDHSTQWPPFTCNTSIQTSLENLSEKNFDHSTFGVVEMGIQVNASQENKFNNEKPFTSNISRMYSACSVKRSPKQARDRMSQTLFAVKNALPDLSFLKNQSVTESGVLRATRSSPSLRNNSKSCQTSLPETNPILVRKLQKRPVSTAICGYRESSPILHGSSARLRSNSVSTAICSSSTSGMDRGYYSCESQLNKLTYLFGDVSENSLSEIPEWLFNRIAYTEQGVCLLCQTKVSQNQINKNSIIPTNSSHFQQYQNSSNKIPAVANKRQISIDKAFNCNNTVMSSQQAYKDKNQRTVTFKTPDKNYIQMRKKKGKSY